MSRFTVDFGEPQAKEQTVISDNQNLTEQSAPIVEDLKTSKKRSRILRFLSRLAAALAGLLIIAGIGSFFYWQTVKKTPAYSLALLVDAARRDDKTQVDQLIDTEAVVNDFMPQITAKAVELYGRNLPPQTIAKIEQTAVPLMPAIDRAKAELPRVIREKTAPVEKVPYWMIALGADRAVDISIQGDAARVVSKIPERPLELTMQRNGNLWKVVGMRDEILAQKIAEKIGQDVIALAAKGGIKKVGEQFGVKNLDEIIKNAESIFNK